MKKTSTLLILTVGCTLIVTAEIKAQSLPNAYADYEFNGNAVDSSGNGFDGTVNGATATTNRFGEANSAMSFVNGDTIWLPINFGSISNLTFSMWLMRPQAGWSFTVFNDGSFRGFGVKWWNDDPQNQTLEIFAGDGTTWFNTLYTTNVPNNEWINLAGVVDDSGAVKQYIDGTLVAQTNMISSIQWAGVDTRVSFGDYEVNPPGPLGSIDQLQFYSTAFTDQQITDLYNSQTVPEPSTYALLLLGGAASLWALKRRKS
jgi:hypothetical protein